jgi:hypothetical protein
VAFAAASAKEDLPTQVLPVACVKQSRFPTCGEVNGRNGFVSRFEQQLESQQKTHNFLYDLLNQVNNYFKGRSDLIYTKLQKASGLSESTDPEDAALLLTEVRRALKDVADFVYPPKKGSVRCLYRVSL